MPVRSVESEFIRSHGIEARTPTDEDIVVIGFSQRTAHGGTEETWQAMLEGRPVITEVMDTIANPQENHYGYKPNPRTRFSSPLPPSYDPYAFLHKEERKEKKWLSTNAVLNIVHGREALAMAGLLDESGRFLNRDLIDPYLFAVSIGSGYGPSAHSIPLHEMLKSERGVDGVSPSLATKMYPEQPNYRLLKALNASGAYTLTLASACASGAQAIVEAVDKLKMGYYVALAGGVEGVLNENEDLVIGSFSGANALSTQNESPTGANRPFDDKRDGFVAASGVAMMALARRSFAEKHGLRAYAKIERRMVSNDASSTMTEADWEIQAQELARMLLDARSKRLIVPIAIFAHATSTAVGDRTEITAYKILFGNLITRESDGNNTPVHIYADKAAKAHLLGASGASAGVSAVMAMRDSLLPGMPLLDNPQAYTLSERRAEKFNPTEGIPVTLFDDVNFRVGKPIEVKNPTILVGNQGFGSHNAYYLVEPV